MPHLEITEFVLVRRNILNNDYQQDSRVLHTLVFDKLFGQLLDISPILYFSRQLIQSFHIIKYDLLIILTK